MTHPLDAQPMRGPTIRHQRADKHLAKINKRLQALKTMYANGVPAYFQPTTGEHLLQKPVPEPGADLVILIGELLYNLRAALDHFTYSLAFNQGRLLNEKAQFPIEDTPEGFKGKRKSYLKGIGNKSVAFFESYQPYKGCNWTKPFVTLSNHDKHREPRWVVTHFDPDTGQLTRTPITDAPPAAFQFNVFQPEVFQTGAVKVDLPGTLDVVFEEGGGDVVQTLTRSVREVGDLLQQGRAEFR